jgi:O-antigen ligase
MTTIAFASIWLFCFVIPWEGVIRVSGVSVASRVAGALALGCTLFAVLFSGRLRRWQGLHIAALVFVLVSGAELLILHVSDKLPQKYWTFPQLFLVLWMIWEVARTRGRLLSLMFAYVMGCYLAAFQTMLMYHRTGGSLRRFAAGNVDPNDLAMTMALAIPMAWYLAAAYRKPILRWICRGYLPVGVLALGLTGSRGGLLCGMFALTIVPFTMLRLTPGRLVMTITLLFLSGGLAVAYVPEKIVQRLATTSTEVEDLSLGGRFRLWKAGMNAFADRPLMGYGTGGFIRAITPQLGTGSQVAHNSFISVLVEEGLIGLILYLLMFLAAYRAVRRFPLLERRFGLVLLGTTLVAMMPLTWEDRKSVWVVLAILVGLSQALRTTPVPSLTEPLPEGPPLVGRPITRRPVAPVAAPREDAAT